ncbi:MAG: tRNA 2-thiouridine(34) synthase MnmA [Spirochaetia bacterium]|nr:tRNA 2-thiouridine(34) synthase MnmA [Spirochaetia bacterium]
MQKMMIAMSGGVDSSVAAFLMRKQGYDCSGITMKLYEDENSCSINTKSCCALSDIEDARSVCVNLNIDYQVYNFKDEFREKVIDKFVYSYENGLTPNPCIDCNRYLKFEHLYKRARLLGFDKIVTGHYARIEEKDGIYYLKKATDRSKDQSYFLYDLNQEQLSHIVFPLGNLNKSEVRVIAESNNFINAKKNDSQDICFVSNKKYFQFIEDYTNKQYKSGDFLDLEGNVIGTHKGIIHYTVGQRRGLGISHSEPLYVYKVDAINNTVILCEKENLFKKEFDVKNVTYTYLKKLESPMTIQIKTRYRQKEKQALLIPTSNNSVHVILDESQDSITPGQAAVFYDGDIVIGGGQII